MSTTNSNGQIQETYDYTAFGESVGADTPSHYGFTGRELDETGLYYYRARFYMPDLGRFTSRDPIGFAGGDVNLYSYVGQNPVNFVDPWGLQPSALAIGWGIAFIEPTPLGESFMFVVSALALANASNDEHWATDQVSAVDLYIQSKQGNRQPNPITEQVKWSVQRTGQDPCDSLKKMRKAAKSCGDRKKMQDIKSAEKYFGCRNKQKRGRK